MAKHKEMVKEKVKEKAKGRKEDRNKIVTGLAAVVMVVMGIGVYFSSGGPPTLHEMMLTLVVLVVVALALVMFWKRFRAYKTGLPAEDEMSRKIFQKAGYYSWMFAIYAALFSRFAGEAVAERTGDWSIVGTYMTVAVILGSALFFFVMYFWFSRKGNV